MKNRSRRTLELFCAKNRSLKHQIFKKWDDFENRPSCKGYSPCKGYSLCKMVSLGQKLKMLKTCEKPFYKMIVVVLWKKARLKTPNTPKMRRFWKSATLQRLSIGPIAHAKALVFAKWPLQNGHQKLKMSKTCETPFYKNTRVVLCKKLLLKTPNIREMRQFWKPAVLLRL